MIAAVSFLTKGLMLDQMTPGGVIAFPAWVEFVEFVCGKWGNTKEGMEEDF